MLGKELLAYVDHTLLRPTATWDDIKEVCEASLRYKTASVCIPPDFVASSYQCSKDHLLGGTTWSPCLLGKFGLVSENVSDTWPRALA